MNYSHCFLKASEKLQLNPRILNISHFFQILWRHMYPPVGISLEKFNLASLPHPYLSSIFINNNKYFFSFAWYHTNSGDLCQQHHYSVAALIFFLCNVWLSTTILCAENDVYTRNYFSNLRGHLIHGLPDFEYLEGRGHAIFIFVVWMLDISYGLNKCLSHK